MKTLQQELIDKKLSDGRNQEKDNLKAKTSKRSKETLSRKDWEELMGVNRETYQKQGGAYRRKR